MFNRIIFLRVLPLSILLLVGCSGQPIVHKDGQASSQRGFTVSNLVKGDTDMVTEIAQRELMRALRSLTEKLYRRNPAEFRKANHASAEAATAAIFAELDRWQDSALRQSNWEQDFRAVFTPDFQGDRVGAYMSAMVSMLMASYDHKRDFYLTDRLDPQKLYNSARNIEVAVWKLSTAVHGNGKRILLTNSQANEPVNLSFEREFGKLIAQQDLIALVIEDSSNRGINRALQNVVSFVFFPI